MDLMQGLLKVMLSTGAGWVLWLLIALSVVSQAIILERVWVFRKLAADLGDLGERLRDLLQSGEVEKARQLLHSKPSVDAQVAYEGLRAFDKGADSVAEAMASAKATQRARMEAHLSFLGTLGNNAPFIGLFGTVIGIIRAFHDLAQNAAGGSTRVMAGISEALVATAMGLFVAIPAVLAYNYFQRRIRTQLSAGDALVHLVLSEMRRAPGTAAAAPLKAAEVTA